jgi:hypothetical protein
MFLSLVPIHEGDLLRINTELQVSLVAALLHRDDPREQSGKLLQKVQEYQKEGVEAYLILLFNFILLLAYLKDGNSLLFYNRCKILKGLLMRILACKLTIPTESLRISQVITLKRMKFPNLNKDIFCGIICFGVLLEWLNRRLTNNNDLKSSILLAHSKALAEDHSEDLLRSVTKFISIVEDQVQKVELKTSAKNLTEVSKVGHKSYSIKVIDYDNGRTSSVPTSRPLSGTRKSLENRIETVNGSKIDPENSQKPSMLLVNGKFLEETTAEPETSRTKYLLKKSQGTSRVFSSRKPEYSDRRTFSSNFTSNLQSVLFPMERLKETSKFQNREDTKPGAEQEKDQLAEDYQLYSSRKPTAPVKVDRSSKSRADQKVAAQTKDYSHVGYVTSGIKKDHKKEAREYLSFGSYYLGLHTLASHLKEPLKLETAKETIQADLAIIHKNIEKDNIGLDISEIKSREFSPKEKTKKFSLNKLMRSGTSYGNTVSDKIDDLSANQNIFSSFGLRKAEMLLLKRPSLNQFVLTQNTTAKTSRRNTLKQGLIQISDQKKEQPLPPKELPRPEDAPKPKPIEQDLESNQGIKRKASVTKKQPYRVLKEKMNSVSHTIIDTERRSSREALKTQRARRMSVVSSIYRVQPGLKEQVKQLAPNLKVHAKTIEEKAQDENEDPLPSNRQSILHNSEEGREENSRLDQSLKNRSYSLKRQDSKKIRPYIGSFGSGAKAIGGSNGDNFTELHKRQSSDHSSSRNGQKNKKSDRDVVDAPRPSKMSLETSPRNSSKHIGPKKEELGLSPRQKMSMVAQSTNKLMSTYKDVNVRRSSFMAQASRRDSVLPHQIPHNILPTEEEHDSSEEKTSKSNVFDRGVPRSSYFIQAETIDSPKKPEILELIHEVEGGQNSPGLSKPLDLQNHEESLDLSNLNYSSFLREDKANFWEKARYLKDKVQMKQELLKFVKGFHILNDFYRKRKSNSLRMGFFVFWFYPDAMLIKKPREGLEEYKSMLDYADDFDMTKEAELEIKPWYDLLTKETKTQRSLSEEDARRPVPSA